ncbi:MAG: hypothetical protein H6526_04360 [Actinobacteria bacterium]|nr:hypothetical protein [Actinomycetota bacterium]MCB8997907.1 hypothetical protein [Actinomycetota bacterium]MCB9414496.1 hypothetical protein [Actinomycetota bacterium]MCB9423944.1 hypothetical protein [Actinomycetota bacterium]HRY10632.1 hypothetical protein [Candidatus Nanopelagicales bacterium]
MAKGNKQSDHWLKVVEAGFSAGLERYQAYRATKPKKPTPREVVLQQRQAIIANHQNRVASHERRLQRMKTRQTIYTAGAAGASAMGVVGTVTPQPSLLWFTAAGVSGILAFLTREKRQTLQAPPMPELPPMPVEPLPTGTPGSDEIARWSRAAHRWDDLLPLVDQMHPDAGLQLRKALADVDPALRSLVERLGTLYRTTQQMPGTQAATAAHHASIEVAARLREGVEAYEGLVAAAAELIAAPDLQQSVTQIVGPAVLDVQAYTSGLRKAAGTFDPSY